VIRKATQDSQPAHNAVNTLERVLGTIEVVKQGTPAYENLCERVVVEDSFGFPLDF
jgi:hypothetical protein